MSQFSLCAVCSSMFYFLMGLFFVAMSSKGYSEPGAIARIVSLSPATTEWVFAAGLGGALVGRTESCDFPAEVSAIKSIGGFLSPSIESIMGLKPDLVLVTSDFNPRRVAEIERTGLRVFQFKVNSTSELLASVEEFGKLIHRKTELQNARELLKKELGSKAMPEGISSQNKYLGFIDLKEAYVFSKTSFLGSLFEEVGFDNLVQVSSAFPQVGFEFLVRQRPDFIFLFEEGVAAKDTLTLNLLELDLLQKYWPRNLTKTKDGHQFGPGFRVVKLPADLFLRPGPRLAQGIASLRNRVMAMQ